MAKLEAMLTGDFKQILGDLEHVIMQSISATLEDSSNFIIEDASCAVRVYERYSAFSGNRLSMTIVLMQKGDTIHFSAITSGGSNAVFFKMDTIGEEAFLDRIREVVSRYRV
ncbi:MAG: hypothetical protein E7195_00175 [Peptococcaceae bacterium]|nr:hypothetical protein [Peptococcaceae bacterium]